MPHKSPFTEEIYLVWDQLVLEKGMRLTLEERVAGWQKLHAMCWQDGKWIVGFMDAGLSANLGMSLAMQQQRWRDANNLSVELLAHAEASSYSRDPGMVQAYSFQVGALIMLGEVDQGVTLGTQLLESKEINWYYRIKFLHSLCGVLHEPSLPKPLDRRIALFAQQVFSKFPGCKTLGKQASKAETAEELLDLIEKVFQHIQERRKKRDSS